MKEQEEPESTGSFSVTQTEEEGGGCLFSTATYGSEFAPQATMTVSLFCDLKVSASNVVLGGVNPNAVEAFSFDLINDGNGDSAATITGAPWRTVISPSDIILVGDTTYGVADNAIAVVSFTGAAQSLGTFLPGEAAETVALSVTINLIVSSFTGDATLDMTVTETGCI